MGFSRQSELDALAKRVSEGLNADEIQTLIQLTNDKKVWLEQREAKLIGIINSIKENSISLSSLIGKAYDIKELRSTAIQFNLIAADEKNEANPSDTAQQGTRNQKNGPVVFTFEKVGGFRASLIRQDSTPPATPNESHIAFFLKPGSTLDKLMALKEATPENEAFLKSTDGEKLLQTWTHWFDTKVSKYLEKHPEKAQA